MRRLRYNDPATRPAPAYRHCDHPRQLAGREPYRGGQHANCYLGDAQHPTPPPPGYRRCPGDPACPILIPTASPVSVCPWHRELWTTADADTWKLMGGERAPRLPGAADL